MRLENTNIIAIIKANQTPSSLSQVGRTRGANTFPLRNQSLALESLKDQLGFLVTKYQVATPLFTKTKKPEINRGSPRRRAPLRGCDNCKNIALKVKRIQNTFENLNYIEMTLKMLKAMQIYQKCIFLGFSFFVFAIFGFFSENLSKTQVKNWVATPLLTKHYFGIMFLLFFFFSIYLSTLSLLRIRLHNCFQITFRRLSQSHYRAHEFDELTRFTLVFYPFC